MFQNHQLSVHHMLLHPSIHQLLKTHHHQVSFLTFRKNEYHNNFYHHLLNPWLLASDYMCILKSQPQKLLYS